MLLDNILVVLFAFRTFTGAQTVCRDLPPHLEETEDEGTEPAGKHVKDHPWKFELS